MNEILRSSSRLDFVWVELTNQCNLECVHCYTSSGPSEGATDALNQEHYKELVSDAYAQGCRRIQFIGGEATLYRQLPELLAFTRELGYECIELYSNLISLSPQLIQSLQSCSVRVATSVYSHQAKTHDTITTRTGSWERTIRNLKRLIARGIVTRASVILMAQNQDQFEPTRDFLRSLGVDEVAADRARAFGRASSHPVRCDMRELCGNCADGVLCVSADGKAYPCVMSRAWEVGRVLDAPLATILRDQPLKRFRHELAEHVLNRDARSVTRASCGPDEPCAPQGSCSPCSPAACSPGQFCTPQAWPRPLAE